MTYDIIKTDQGWYNFENLPQGYLKITWMKLDTDRKALNQAKKIAPGANFNIVEG